MILFSERLFNNSSEEFNGMKICPSNKCIEVGNWYVSDLPELFECIRKYGVLTIALNLNSVKSIVIFLPAASNEYLLPIISDKPGSEI